MRYSAAVAMQILIIHSKSDTVVPVEDAYALYARVQTKKKLWVVENACHVHIHRVYPKADKRSSMIFLVDFVKSNLLGSYKPSYI